MRVCVCVYVRAWLCVETTTLLHCNRYTTFADGASTSSRIQGFINLEQQRLQQLAGDEEGVVWRGAVGGGTTERVRETDMMSRGGFLVKVKE